MRVGQMFLHNKMDAFFLQIFLGQNRTIIQVAELHKVTNKILGDGAGLVVREFLLQSE